MRRAAKIDANHREIVNALRRCGAKVLDLSRVGAGCPDLLVALRRSPHGAFVNVLVEVKDGALAPSARQLTDAQKAFHSSWPGEIHVVASVSEALDLFKPEMTA